MQVESLLTELGIGLSSSSKDYEGLGNLPFSIKTGSSGNDCAMVERNWRLKGWCIRCTNVDRTGVKPIYPMFCALHNTPASL